MRCVRAGHQVGQRGWTDFREAGHRGAHLSVEKTKGRRRPTAGDPLVTKCQGAFENEKMSELPNVDVAPHEVGGSGFGFGVIPSCRFSR